MQPYFTTCGLSLCQTRTLLSWKFLTMGASQTQSQSFKDLCQDSIPDIQSESTGDPRAFRSSLPGDATQSRCHTTTSGTRPHQLCFLSFLDVSLNLSPILNKHWNLNPPWTLCSFPLPTKLLEPVTDSVPLPSCCLFIIRPTTCQHFWQVSSKCHQWWLVKPHEHLKFLSLTQHLTLSSLGLKGPIFS